MTFPINTVRSAFPALQMQGEDGQPVVFFDNPAGTQVPAPVAVAISDTILYSNANLGGKFRTSQTAGQIHERAHQVMATFLGSSYGGASITIAQSMTALTYAVSRALSRNWQEGDEIIVTSSDHEGNVYPWVQAAKDKGVTVRILRFDADRWQLQPEALASLLSERTKLVALNYANNMTGSINHLAPLISLAHQKGALCYVDAVQYTPHHRVNVQQLDCDFLVCSSYKFFGPHLGILYTRPEIFDTIEAYKVRPVPDQGSKTFAYGTSQIELLAGLIATVEYFVELGHWVAEAEERTVGNREDAIALAYEASIAYEQTLSACLIKGLHSLERVNIMGITDANRLSERVPTVSITVEGMSHHFIAQKLAEAGIFCWSGHNYALETALQLGLELDDAVVRIGMTHYNTPEEVDRLLGKLHEIISS